MNFNHILQEKDVNNFLKCKEIESIIPPLGLGTLRLRGKECITSIRMALELGYRHIDTASYYENHLDIRKGIGNFDRDQLFITSKFLTEQGDLESACNIALKELGLDYLDLYLIHWPDRQQQMGNLLKQMENLQSQGKINYFGVSNFTIHHLQDILKEGFKILCNQVEFHPYLHQAELWTFCKQHSIQLVSYRPLGKGNILDNSIIKKTASEYGKTPAQIILRWINQKKIPVLVKASCKEHLQENLDIFDFVLRDTDIEILDGLNCNKRFCITKWADFDY